MKLTRLILSTAAFIFVCSIGNVQAQDPVELLKKFDQAVTKYTKLQYTFNYKERMKGEGIIEGDLDLYIEEGAQKKVHAVVRKPEEAKLWYREGEMGNKVMTHLGIALGMYNKRLMKNGQHPLDRAGFMRTRDITMDTYRARKDELASAIQVKGSVTFDGRDCYHIVILDKDYGTTKYTVQAGDNLLKIAEKKAVPEMRIMELNDGISDYFDVKEGEVITIPTSYASKTTIYLDKATYLPIYQKVEDDLGLFAEYKHYNLKVNEAFPDRIFYRK